MRRVSNDGGDDQFATFYARAQPRLQRALIAAYGPVDGRAVTVDSLSWAWEHWEQLRDMANPIGYLFRVGQSASRKYVSKPVPTELELAVDARFPDIEPRLLSALERLSVQQRTVVVLVHAMGWPQAEVAELLDVNPSTVREHLGRAMRHLPSSGSRRGLFRLSAQALLRAPRHLRSWRCSLRRPYRRTPAETRSPSAPVTTPASCTSQVATGIWRPASFGSTEPTITVHGSPTCRRAVS